MCMMTSLCQELWKASAVRKIRLLSTLRWARKEKPKGSLFRSSIHPPLWFSYAPSRDGLGFQKNTERHFFIK